MAPVRTPFFDLPNFAIILVWFYSFTLDENVLIESFDSVGLSGVALLNLSMLVRFLKLIGIGRERVYLDRQWSICIIKLLCPCLLTLRRRTRLWSSCEEPRRH